MPRRRGPGRRCWAGARGNTRRRRSAPYRPSRPIPYREDERAARRRVRDRNLEYLTLASRLLYRDSARDSLLSEPTSAECALAGGQCEFGMAAAARQNPGAGIAEAFTAIFAPAAGSIQAIARL